MSKNEYRRALIMLRPAISGVSGHARLERRTMTGSLYFIVSAQGEGWQAALVGQRSGEYYAAALGALKPDDRGQLTLAYAFDPRSIAGRPLEAYQLLAVAQVDAQGCKLALTGNVEGAYPMDPALVEQAVCALYTADEPAADLPAPEALEVTFSEPAAPANADVEYIAPEALEPEPTPEPVPEPMPEPVPVPESVPEPEPTHTKIYTRMRSSVSAAEAADPAPSEAAPDPDPSATDAGWCAPTAAPCAMPLEDGYSYIRLPLPAACGLDYCMLGVRTQNNRVASVRCALPGQFSPTPPRGIPGGVWLSTGDGTGAGYWVVTVKCEESA